MSGGSLTANCSDDALKQCSSHRVCPVNITTTFHTTIGRQLWRINALTLIEAVLAVIIVVIGAYGQRYRHHPITRFLFLGATTLFLPIISNIISTIRIQPSYIIHLPDMLYDDINPSPTYLISLCNGISHSLYLIVLVSLVQIIMINTSTIVSVDDREGTCIGPPLELLVQVVWTIYLGFSGLVPDDIPMFIMFVPPYILLCCKIGLKCYAFQGARRSFALGRNPGLVFVYMQQLQADETNQHVPAQPGEDTPPPPLLVMREAEEKVEKHPHGYIFKFKDESRTTLLSKNVGLATLDKVWQLDSKLPIATPRSKHLCLSFALFKLLRCRFARYKLTSSGSDRTLNFFQSMMLKVGQHDKVFAVITEELSFLHDYYYSSLPISYCKGLVLPVLAIFLSLLTIGYCIWMSKLHIEGIDIEKSQLSCEIWCVNGYLAGLGVKKDLGESHFDVVPPLLVLVLAVTAEVRDMASYICSNWTTVTLICKYINGDPPQHPLCMQKLVSFLLRCRCKLMKHWDEKMGQCSVLVPHTKTFPIVLVYRLLRVTDQRRKVKVPAAVKVSIINAVRNLINGHFLSNGAESLRRQSQVGETFLWACNDKGTSDIILTWHIATCILEVKHPYIADHQEQGSPPNPSSADYKIAATHLSKYCAYLVSWCPELLPDTNSAWSQSLYKAVKKDAEHALSGRARSSEPEDEYQKLVDLLSANSKHDVLKNGVKLAMQLAGTINCEETTNGEETVWKLLADFWSEMILFVAPSDNLKGHSEAIARGGELITLLWVLLFHAGIVSRPGEEDGTAAPSAGPV